MNFWQKWKVQKAAMKRVEEAMALELEKQMRLEALINTDSMVEAIKELMQQVNNGCEVTITLTNGNKIDIKPRPEFQLPTSNKPFFDN